MSLAEPVLAASQTFAEDPWGGRIATAALSPSVQSNQVQRYADDEQGTPCLPSYSWEGRTVYGCVLIGGGRRVEMCQVSRRRPTKTQMNLCGTE